MSVQEDLEAIRKAKGHTYKFLTDFIGGSPSNLAYGLQGKTNPTVGTLMKVAEFYGYDITLKKKETR